MEAYQETIRYMSYARWVESLERREVWDESVDRYQNFFEEKLGLAGAALDSFRWAIGFVRRKEVMPSMRALWTAGPALERDNAAGYNCAYLAIDRISSFSEMLYLLMCGAGGGFSVERQIIAQLPEVPRIKQDPTYHVVKDSKAGWAAAVNTLIEGLYEGREIQLDYSKIRPAGAILKTFGGRASGPGPLIDLVKLIKKIFIAAQGRKLRSIEIFDICCMIAQCVVSGGVRRSATICLCNLSDLRMREAKSGDWFSTHPWRAFANISVAYEEQPDPVTFLDEWQALIRSGSGERGIFNREGARAGTDRDLGEYPGANPCVEILLRNRQFCNLTEVVARADDTVKSLKQKIKAATILGTIQSTLTDFRFLPKEWKENCEEERLLGVSITGSQDSPLRSDGDLEPFLEEFSEVAYHTNYRMSQYLGINPSHGITCVKPSGTVSQLVNSSSGLHPRFAPYYIRRVRMSRTDPLCEMLKAQGVPWSPENDQTVKDHHTAVFEFPIKSPEGAICKDDVTAEEQLDTWLHWKQAWCDHNPSVTINVKEHEWISTASWIYDNWDQICGLSFLPSDGGSFTLLPYEEITEGEYNRLLESFPSIDFSELERYEQDDRTEGARELACSGTSCEIG